MGAQGFLKVHNLLGTCVKFMESIDNDSVSMAVSYYIISQYSYTLQYMQFLVDFVDK